MATIPMYLGIGITAGVFAGFFGVGGGIVLIPLLLWFAKLSQHQAQGISLAALVLPVGILGALTYYRAQPFGLKAPLVLALGLFIGAYFGGMFAQKVSDRSLQIAFGVIMLAGGIKLILGK